MQAEIIAIGSELTSGAKLDTNSQWLSLQLADLGIPVGYHTTVADDLQANIEVLRTAIARVELIVITGGLGPTLDDLTRESLAAATERPLEIDPESWEHVESFFRSRQRQMPERNRIQAMLPAGATALRNPIGTAPGIWMRVPRGASAPCLIAALPGVPSEMFQMFHEQVRPLLPGGAHVIRRARIHCFGIGESTTEELLGDLTARGRDPDVGITAHEATITLRILAQGDTAEECDAKIATVSQLIRARLGDYVFGEEEDELEHVVVRALRSRALTFSTLEMGTAGLLAQRIAHVPDADGCYLAGTVLMTQSQPLDALVKEWQQQLPADFLIAVGPQERRVDSEGHGDLVMEIGLFEGSGEIQRTQLHWSGNPHIARSRAAKAALDLLRRHLLSIP